jgi:hypothetical protein
MGLNLGSVLDGRIAGVASRLRKPKWAVSPAISGLLVDGGRQQN